MPGITDIQPIPIIRPIPITGTPILITGVRRCFWAITVDGEEDGAVTVVDGEVQAGGHMADPGLALAEGDSADQAVVVFMGEGDGVEPICGRTSTKTNLSFASRTL